MNYLRILKSALIALSLALPQASMSRSVAKAIPAKPALWLVRDSDTKIYLFGTIHALPENINWYGGAVKSAFDQSDNLVIEMVEPSPAQATAEYRRTALDPKGRKLRSWLSEKQQKSLDGALDYVGLPRTGYDILEPWAAAMQLQVAILQKGGVKGSAGVEPLLKVEAKRANKPVSELESFATQLGFLDTLPMNTQIDFLMSVAQARESVGGDVAKLLGAWTKPDPDKFARLTTADLADDALVHALLTGRNAKWALWIKKRLEQPGTTFMAVGTAHLAGKQSVQIRLGELGISARRVKY
jgi:uncharacterized protein